MENVKCVMVIDEELPVGFIANTAAIMGLTLGKYMSEAIGCSVEDKSGNEHLGIIQIPVPILKADSAKIKAIREQLYEYKQDDVIVMDFSDIAQKINVYEEWIEKAKLTNTEDMNYLGVAIYGNKKIVNKLTGSLPLLR